MYLMPLAEGFPLDFVMVLGSKELVMPLSDCQKKCDDISIRLDIVLALDREVWYSRV